ncbi:MAG: hypothetical protein B6U95_07195 [Thermofilum sp. ex4484_82]|nr:hypothetical protein [Thermoproteales archaeon]OYT26658.1 MAG: hypothetical protein B6U95_07195 [Thermofilum sp. ex4484_82]OYT37243.1 MAG: hypothetical protein B6U96_07190 [Archaeoglobales archaeon ex4484_92]RLE77714.1 MAG: hypothetical protein DRJ44_01415 [Thermoprotei archaeon]
MGRKKSKLTIERAKEVYKILLENKDAMTTPQLFNIVLKKSIITEYSILYQILKMLKDKGLVEQTSEKGLANWEVIKVVDLDTLEKIIST